MAKPFFVSIIRICSLLLVIVLLLWIVLARPSVSFGKNSRDAKVEANPYTLQEYV